MDLADVFANVRWGDAPTWAALLAAGVAAYFAGRAYRIESERDRLADLDRLKAQASMVAAWATNTDGGWLAVIRNASSLPVFDVDVRIIGHKIGGTPPPFFDIATDTMRVLPPGEVTIAVGTEPFGVALVFRDSAYNIWVRGMHGGLHLRGRGPDPYDGLREPPTA